MKRIDFPGVVSVVLVLPGATTFHALSSEFGIVLVNAVNEQQQQIENLRRTVPGQKQTIDRSMKFVCSLKTEPAVCGEN